jgi:DNA-binding MarR family transcriptional regulator
MGAVPRSRNFVGNEWRTDGEAPDELVVLLIRTAKAIVDEVRAERPAASSPMTPVHGLAARYLLGRDDVTTVELARYLGITKQSTSEVVALLEKTGTVRRAPHPSDGRARVLLLTDDGKQRLEQGRLRWQRVEDEWAEVVGRERLDVVRGVLEEILAADLVARDGRIPVDQNSSCVAS